MKCSRCGGFGIMLEMTALSLLYGFMSKVIPSSILFSTKQVAPWEAGACIGDFNAHGIGGIIRIEQATSSGSYTYVALCKHHLPPMNAALTLTSNDRAFPSIKCQVRSSEKKLGNVLQPEGQTTPSEKRKMASSFHSKRRSMKTMKKKHEQVASRRQVQSHRQARSAGRSRRQHPRY